MKYFFDTEFIEDGKTIDLISIGIVDQDGREFYAESNEINLDKANDWVKQNVIPNLWYLNNKDKEEYPVKVRDGSGLWSRKRIKNKILEFIGTPKPEFWGYYADYDWVVLCQLFGCMLDLPKGWPMYCNDLKQLCVMVGDPKLSKQNNEHNALYDAFWVREQYFYLHTLPILVL